MSRWTPKDAVQEMLIGISPSAVPVGNFLQLRTVNEGTSFELTSDAPGGNGLQQVCIVRSDLQALVDVLTLLLASLDPVGSEQSQTKKKVA